MKDQIRVVGKIAPKIRSHEINDESIQDVILSKFHLLFYQSISSVKNKMILGFSFFKAKFHIEMNSIQEVLIIALSKFKCCNNRIVI